MLKTSPSSMFFQAPPAKLHARKGLQAYLSPSARTGEAEVGCGTPVGPRVVFQTLIWSNGSLLIHLHILQKVCSCLLTWTANVSISISLSQLLSFPQENYTLSTYPSIRYTDRFIVFFKLSKPSPGQICSTCHQLVACIFKVLQEWSSQLQLKFMHVDILSHCAFDSHKLEVTIKPPDTHCVCKSKTEIIAHEIESSG